MKIAALGLAIAIAAAAALFSGCGGEPPLDSKSDAVVVCTAKSPISADCPGTGLYPMCTQNVWTIVPCGFKDKAGRTVQWCADVDGDVAGCSFPPKPGAAPVNCYWGCP